MVIALRNLLHYLSIGASDCVQDFSNEIKNELKTKKDWNVLLISLLQYWSKTINDECNEVSCHFISAPCVTTSSLVEIIEIFGCEKIFCQMLLLLPEIAKQELLSELCFFLRRDKCHCHFVKILVKETFTTHSQNFMYDHNEKDNSIHDAFYDNISNVLGCIEFVQSDDACCYLFYLMENLLDHIKQSDEGQRPILVELDKYGDNQYLNNSILNKVEKVEVKKLQTYCVELRKGVTTSASTMKMQDVLYMNIAFVEFVTRILTYFCGCLKDICYTEKVETALSDTIVKAVLNLKTYVFLLETKKSDNDKYAVLTTWITKFLKLCSSAFTTNDLVQYICCEEKVVTDLSIMCEAFLETDEEVLLSLWKEEKNQEKKILLGLSRLNNLYYGHVEVLEWLLDYQCVDNHRTAYISTLCVYTINFGSISLVQRYMDLLLCLHCGQKRSCIQKLLMKCTPYFSIQFCNNVISTCLHCYYGYDSKILIDEESRIEFEVELDEVMNKLTDDEGKLKIMSQFAGLCVMSPITVVKKMVERIFSGNLKYTVFVNALSTLPSLLLLKLEKTSVPAAVIVVIREAFMSCQSTNSTLKYLLELLTGILISATEPDQLAIAHHIIDMFVMEDIQQQDTLPLEATLNLLSSCLNCLKNKTFEMRKSLLLLEFLLSQERQGATDNEQQLIHHCINVFVDILSWNFEQADTNERAVTLMGLKEVLLSCDWTQPFHFHSFFTLYDNKCQFGVPSTLLDVCIDAGQWEPLHINETDKWTALLQLSTISIKHALSFITGLPVFDADDEVPSLIDAATTIFSANVSKFKAEKVMECLKELIKHEKIKNVTTYFSNDLQSATEHHGACFAMLIFVQSFVALYSDVTAIDDKMNMDCQHYVTILYIFVNHAKNMTDNLISVHFTLYLLEQLIYASDMFNDVVKKHSSLLLMNVLLASLDFAKCLHGEERKNVLKKCKDILDVSDDDFCLVLKEKYDTFISQK